MEFRVHRIDFGPGEGGPRRIEGPTNPLARVARAIIGGVAIAGAAIAGLFMGGVLLVFGAVAAVVGLGVAAYLRWRMRKVIQEAEKQMKEAGKEGGPQVFMGRSPNGAFEFFMQSGGPGRARGSEAGPFEEPVEVEAVEEKD